MPKFPLDLERDLHTALKQRALDESTRRGYRVTMNDAAVDALREYLGKPLPVKEGAPAASSETVPDVPEPKPINPLGATF